MDKTLNINSKLVFLSPLLGEMSVGQKGVQPFFVL